MDRPNDFNLPWSDRRRRTIASAFFVVIVTSAVPSWAGGIMPLVAQQSPAGQGFASMWQLVAVGVVTIAACVTAVLLWDAAERNRKLRIALKAHDRNLITERNLLRGLIDALPDNIFIKDIEGRYIIDNLAHQHLLGLARPEDVVGRTVFDFFPLEIAKAYQADDDAVFHSGQPLIGREEPIVEHGRKGWVSTTKVLLRDGDGSITGLVCITRDITDRRRAEEDLREKNRLLELAVRSEQEAHAALKQAQVRLIQSEKLVSLGRLVAGVAHEINNPLAFVSNNVVVLQRDLKSLVELLQLYQSFHAGAGDRDPELAKRINELAERIDLPYTLESVPELLTRSRDGLKRIQDIVRDLRDFSRQETVGSNQPETDLNPGVQSTVNIVRARAAKQKVDVVMDLAPLPSVVCLPSRINQVILNLVVNAIDACPNGGTVTVRTRTADGGVEIDVTDTGTGIDPSVRDTIFDPFFTTKPQGQGTGLGLSLSHGIIQDHGGRIDVVSAPGEGSTFTIYLPCRPAILPGQVQAPL